MAGKPTQTAPRGVSAAAVARAAGVSPATVSYVMNELPGVSTQTRERVLALAQDMGYAPAHGVRVPAARRNNVIGLVVPNIVNPMFPRWAQGITERAAETNYEVFLAATQEDPEAMRRSVQAMIARRVDGLVLTSVSKEDAGPLHMLKTAHIPYVQLSRKSDVVPADFVGIDDAGAARTMMMHLVGHGRSMIATAVGPRTSSASATREVSFLQAAQDLGRPIRPDWRISTRLNNIGGRQAAQALLSGPELPDVIACGSDEIAIGVMEYLIKHGMRVPEDVLVTGFDGLPHSRSELVGLTSVVQPQIQMAYAAFDVLQDRLDNPSCVFKTLIMPHELWIGRTCGCPPARRSTAGASLLTKELR